MDAEALYNEIETKAICRADQSWTTGTSLAEDSRQAIAYAMEEMKRLGKETITPRHLLIGVLRASPDVIGAFEKRGADLESVRQACTEVQTDIPGE